MKIEQTTIPGVVLIEPRVFADERGCFFETFHASRYVEASIRWPFPQDNRSVSNKGVLRGLHYQIQHPQGYLVTITRGSIFDVAVDLRRNSPTFGRIVCATLTAEPPRQIFLPPGLAHGFCVLSDTAEIWYKCTEIYYPNDEGGLLWSDPDLGIDWPLREPIISHRDATYPRLRDIPLTHLPQANF